MLNFSDLIKISNFVIVCLLIKTFLLYFYFQLLSLQNRSPSFNFTREREKNKLNTKMRLLLASEKDIISGCWLILTMDMAVKVFLFFFASVLVPSKIIFCFSLHNVSEKKNYHIKHESLSLPFKAVLLFVSLWQKSNIVTKMSEIFLRSPAMKESRINNEVHNGIYCD